jgi:hypothetical protein
MPAVNGVGKPCDREGHARIDGRELETEHPDHGHGEERPSGKPVGANGSMTYRQAVSPRQFPTLLHHRLVTSRPRDGRRPVTFLARWPADKAMQHARDRVRDLTAQHRLLLSVEAVVQDINEFLQGWVGYFKYGHSARCFSKIRMYVRMRIALFLSRKHRRSRHCGWWALLSFTSNEFGLISLYGVVVSPRAGKPWREKSNAGGERRR